MKCRIIRLAFAIAMHMYIHKTLSFIIVALIIFTGSYKYGHADDTEYLNELDRLNTDLHLTELTKRILNPINSREVKLSLDWLREKFTTGKGGARIAYLYSALLNEIGIRDTAAFSYITARLMVRIDAARCADITAPPEKISHWEKGLSERMMSYYSELNEAEQKRLLNMAFKWEKKLLNRAPDKWLCSGGEHYYAKFYEKHGLNENPPVRIILYPFARGKSIVVNAPDYKPEYVNKQLWAQRRKDIIASFELGIAYDQAFRNSAAKAKKQQPE